MYARFPADAEWARLMLPPDADAPGAARPGGALLPLGAKHMMEVIR